MLNTNNKITYFITGQQAPGCILDTHLYMHYLEYVTKGEVLRLVTQVRLLLTTVTVN